MKNLILFLLFVIGLSLTGCGAGSDSGEAERYQPRLSITNVKTVAATQESLAAKIDFTGNLLPRRVTHIAAEVEGRVDFIPKLGAKIDIEANGQRYSDQLGINYGLEVKEGDVLAKLDTRDADIALKVARAKKAKAEADLAKLKAWERPEEIRRLTSLRDEAAADHQFAIRNLRRLEELSQKNAISQSDLDQAGTELSRTKAKLEAAEAVLVQAKAGPTEEEIAVLESVKLQADAEIAQHERSIEKATIVSPIGGVITSFDVEVGDRVSPNGNPIAQIMDLDFLAAEIAVPEQYVGQIKLQDRAQVAIAGTTEPVQGLIIAINDYVDFQTRTYQVRIAIDNRDRRFKAGQFATVTLSIGQSDPEQVVIPRDAIIYLEGEPHVFVVEGDLAKAHKVRLGNSTEDLVEIRSGISPGDRVVVDDPTLLTDGIQVTVDETQ